MNNHGYSSYTVVPLISSSYISSITIKNQDEADNSLTKKKVVTLGGGGITAMYIAVGRDR